MKIKNILKKNFIQSLLSYILSKIIRIISSTLRIEVLNKEIYEELRQKNKRLIYATWHNRLFYIPYFLRERNLQILVSESHDGKYVSKTLERFNFFPIEGSSTRGGAKAAFKMINMLKKGYDGGITPDGPQGPKYYLKRGIIDIAKKSGHTILPITYGVKKRWELNSWDNFIIPFPFSKGVVVYGRPFEVKEELSLEEIEEIRKNLEEELIRITKIADD